MNTRPRENGCLPCALSRVSAVLGNGSGSWNAEEGREGVLAAGVASHYAGHHRSLQTPVLRAGNSRGEDGRLDGATLSRRALPSNPSLVSSVIKAFRHYTITPLCYYSMWSVPALPREMLKAR
jgi:hypothetical protein